MPTPEEIAEFKVNHKQKPLKNFNEAEKYLLMIISIPEFQTRLACWKFMLEFNDCVTTFAAPVTALSDAIKSVRESANFKTILSFILAIGNYMNGGTNKGQADAFNLKCLPKLDMTKDRTNKFTLINYICNTCFQKHPEVADLTTEMQPVAIAKDVKLDEVERELDNINNSFKSM